MTLDDLYTDIVAEELDADAAPQRLAILTHREAELALALLAAVVNGDTGEEVRTTARALSTRLGMRLPAT
ncbi:hypothetical protein GCM10010347_59300 [Streptomyces cirratus]|uniref:Uncharacterized protein n=1 Tax=Streptomyces cirratus TaxID=68187 RepID=A0ABQ3F1E3_9ACTN|nr:hypothetical protein [Streptomyces cirratus]GHB80728.1 hypothetical protein GCM10010347_59300 [Streptomyces cirratus]